MCFRTRYDAWIVALLAAIPVIMICASFAAHDFVGFYAILFFGAALSLALPQYYELHSRDLSV